MMMGGFGMGFAGLIIMALFWGGLILGAIWLASVLFPTVKKQTSHSNSSAKEILKTRYAQGEISKQEYQDMLKTIQ